jgi:uncharacterized cupredoxin-like copper-binding protein
MVQTKRFTRALLTAFLAGVILLAGLGTANAQTAPAAHPAAIHNGTCADLGDVAYRLTPLPSSEFATPSPDATGAPTAHRADTSVTILGVALTDLLASPHAITVQESESAAANDIVCGDVGGVVSDGELAIGLHEANGSGDAGLAVLHATKSGTEVTVYLVHALVAVSTTPRNEGTVVGVTITDLRIDATQTTFLVGSTYTFVIGNLGTTEHELVIERQGEPGRPLVSGNDQARVTAIPPGQSKMLTWTFTEPGSYLLSCHLPGRFEAGMYLPIEVTAPRGSPTSPGPLPPPQPVLT